jgi:hypothetical protein
MLRQAEFQPGDSLTPIDQYYTERSSDFLFRVSVPAKIMLMLSPAIFHLKINAKIPKINKV